MNPYLLPVTVCSADIWVVAVCVAGVGGAVVLVPLPWLTMTRAT